MTDDEWQSSWRSNIVISRAQLSEVLSRAAGLDKVQLTEAIETFDELAKRYIKCADAERRREQMKQVHIAVKIGDTWGPLCGTKEPKFLTSWPEDVLASNGPSGCPECLKAYGERGQSAY